MSTRQLSGSDVSAAVDSAVARAAGEGRVLNVRTEALRISKAAGTSARAVAGELIVMGIKARANIEFPRSGELDGSDEPIAQ